MTSTSSSENINICVVDVGSYQTKAGSAAAESTAPSTLFATNTSASSPAVSRGIIQDLDQYEKILLQCVPGEKKEWSLLVIEPVLASKRQREIICEVVFEKLQSPSLGLFDAGRLAMIGAGRATGLSVILGDQVLQTAAVYEGNLVPHSSKRAHKGGYDIGQLLQKSLMLEAADLVHLNAVKEHVTSLTTSRDQTALAGSKSYELPDGKVVSVGAERCTACEQVYFKGADTIIDLIQESVGKCTTPLDMYRNIVLSGGCSSIHNLKERVAEDLEKLLPGKTRVSKDVSNASWVGGVILAQTSSYLSLRSVYTKEEYDESGPNYIHNRSLCW